MLPAVRRRCWLYCIIIAIYRTTSKEANPRSPHLSAASPPRSLPGPITEGGNRMDAQQTIAQASSLWALLVGINVYRSAEIRPLRGCVNDVQAMKVFLMNQLNVPEGHIRVLTDQEATRAGILAAFQE